MAVFRAEWTLLILVILKIAFSSSEETCKKEGVCSCELSNGQKIDLKPLDGTATTPGFVGLKSADTSGRTFDWNPCTPFKLFPDQCNQENLLVAQIDASLCYAAGKDDTSFSVDSAGNVVVTYGSIESGQGQAKALRSTKITLKCDPKVAKGSWTAFQQEVIKETKTTIYSSTLSSKHACATGTPTSGNLSTGSILLIIFFPLLLIYLIVGVLINRFGRGIQSMPELIPNHSFWADFPFLVKDGVVFTCGCIKTACYSLSRKCNKDGYAEI